MILCAIISGCMGLKEIGTAGAEENLWTGPGLHMDTDSSAICYVTGIDYPTGYDWRNNETSENVRCSLVVFSDGVPMLKIPIGDGHEVSADPDRHRVIDGHLYTEYCHDGFTVIRKDGKAFMKYEGEESIRGLIVDGQNVYTLGIPRNGKGFTYRKNGESIVERRTGYAFERLIMDDGKICFAFCQPVSTSEGPEERFYMVRNGRTSLIDINDEVGRVWDIISCNGTTWTLTSSGPWNTVELTRDGLPIAVNLPAGAEMLSCRMFSSGEEICIEGEYSQGDSLKASGIWIMGDEYMRFETGQSISSSCSGNGDICCVLNPTADNQEGIIFKNGHFYQMPEDFICTGNNPIAVHEGILHIGLTSLSDQRPILWQDGQTTRLKLNGPICTLSVSASS